MRNRQRQPGGLNGFMLPMHVGPDPVQTDKLYNHPDTLPTKLRRDGYELGRVDTV